MPPPNRPREGGCGKRRETEVVVHLPLPGEAFECVNRREIG